MLSKSIKTLDFSWTSCARPLRRYIQREIETSLAKKILANEVHEKSNVLIDLDNDHIVFKEV